MKLDLVCWQVTDESFQLITSTDALNLQLFHPKWYSFVVVEPPLKILAASFWKVQMERISFLYSNRN